MLVFPGFSWFSWFFLTNTKIFVGLVKKTRKTRKTKEKQAFLKTRPGKPGKTNAFALLLDESIVFTMYSMFIRIVESHVGTCGCVYVHRYVLPGNT